MHLSYLCSVSVDDSGSLGCHLLCVVPHQRQVVAAAKGLFQEEGGATAAQLTMRDDGDAIAQDVRLVHVVRGQDDGVICWENRRWISVTRRGGEKKEAEGKTKAEEEQEEDKEAFSHAALCVTHPRFDVSNKQAEYKTNFKLRQGNMK